MTTPNPFNTGDSLKGVIDAAAEIIGGEPVLPDDFSSHADAAAEEIAGIEGPTTNDDLTKIMQKHFNAGSKNEPQTTKLQQVFQKEVGKRVNQSNQAKKWSEG